MVGGPALKSMTIAALSAPRMSNEEAFEELAHDDF
jgi:hypothetical protein